jgi:hypothetical protein
MSSKRKRDLVTSQDAVDRLLGKLDYPEKIHNGTSYQQPCRAPSCGKLVLYKHTVNGYCLACVEKAKQVRLQRLRAEKKAREDATIYDNNDYGVF